MHPNPRRVIPVILLLAVAGGAAWWYFGGRRAAADTGVLSASGTIEAIEVNLSPELGGRATAVNVKEGDVVEADEVLVQFDTALLTAQRTQAAAALAAAVANYTSLNEGASASMLAAQVAQAELQVLNAQQALTTLRDSAALATAQAQVAAAQAQDNLERAERDLRWVKNPASESLYDAASDAKLALDTAQANRQLANVSPDVQAYTNNQWLTDWYFRRYQDLKAKYDASNGNLDLADRVQTAWADYQTRLDQQNALRLRIDTDKANKDNAVAKAQEKHDDAVANLNDALAGPDATKLALAQAKVAAAKAALADAQDHYANVQTGPDPDQLALAESRLAAAQASLAAAKAALSPERLDAAKAQVDLAQAALDVLDAQIAKLTLKAPVDGVVLSRNIEPGEVASPGATLLVLGRLDDLTITVYVPEDRYGNITLGQTAKVSVDSFPGETFTAAITHIADEAEFTPRNVQTVSGRKTTVFAIKLSIDNPAGKLKPGMPADVKFGD